MRQVFRNLAAVAEAAGSSLDRCREGHGVPRRISSHFAIVNEVMAEFFTKPYPARAAIGVASLPRGAVVEADAVLVP